ncbi:Hsp20/alpha crystallin family protein [Pseudochryseolinea flava]|nr:Hsp20/alpha crystallin family protein [Pseudochryseolinea flava]
MKKHNYLDLGTAVDVLNTINGGMSEPQMIVNHNHEGREIRMRIPGISRDSLHVEIHNNSLTIYHYTTLLSQDMMIDLPRIVYSKVIPYFIDINKISAHTEDEDLIVELPYNRLSNGFHRDLKIQE